MLWFWLSIACTHRCPNVVSFLTQFISFYYGIYSVYFLASNTKYVLSCLVYSISPQGCLIRQYLKPYSWFQLLVFQKCSSCDLPVSVNVNHILRTFLVGFDFSCIRTSDQSTNPVNSTFKTHLESDHFSLPQLLRLWSEPPELLQYCCCCPCLAHHSAVRVRLSKHESHHIVSLFTAF